MLYVFHVDNGTMKMFDMSLALESVTSLKKAIERECKIPIDKQVLLVSGGECLNPDTRVCFYSSGTDTNPIFLFSKGVLESVKPPSEPADVTSDLGNNPSVNSDRELMYNDILLEELKEKVSESQHLPPTYQAVVARSEIASLMNELSKEQTKICEGLVLDQHLQQQGWCAVIANLDDITSEFKKRTDIFFKHYQEYLAEQQAYIGLVENFNNDLEVLAKIPILPALLENDQGIHNPIEASGSEEKPEEKDSPDQSVERRQPSTLLEWIVAADNKSSMEQLYKNCNKGLNEYTENLLQTLQQEVQIILEAVDKPDMKEVKGIGDRLFGLEQLLNSAKKYVQEQSDLAQSFLQNQARANNLGDTSILPDLCASHKKQLIVMFQNHQQICDIRRRCTKAKEELSNNIYIRLRWIMFIESNMLDVDQKLVIHNESIRRLRKQFEVLRQIHLAPSIYLSALTETIRRKAFSQAYLLWASDLACHLLTIYNEEVTRRKEFQAQFEGHFLTTLFPGMEDMPPTFATQAPSIFDSSLPKVTVDDVINLKQQVPELTESMTVPDTSSVTNFFLARSVVKSDDLDKVDDSKAVEEKLVQVVNEIGLASNLDQNILKATENEQSTTSQGLPHLKDLDKGCESETDTEEFEKVGQSPLDLHFDKEIPSPKPGTQDASTLTEVGERSPIPPKKPPRTFQKLHIYHEESSSNLQRTLSVSSSNTDSFTNVKMDELSGLKNISSNSESCFNSHHQQMQSYASSHFLHSKSISPHTPQSPREVPGEHYLSSPIQGHQPNEFVTDEFYIDESLPSSLSIETGQSQGEFVRQLDTVHNVVAMLQENLEASRCEQDKLKSFLIRLSSLSQENLSKIREDLGQLKIEVGGAKIDLVEKWGTLDKEIENVLLQQARCHEEALKKLADDCDLKIVDLEKSEKEKIDEITYLKERNANLEDTAKSTAAEVATLQQILKIQTEKYNSEIEQLKNVLQNLAVDKEKSLKEVADQLNRDHKAEIENIRSKFRLMTMESTDKSSDDSAIRQIRETFEKQSKREAEEAVKQETTKWEQKLEELRIKHELSMNDISKQISEEKDRQIDLLQERAHNLNLECSKHKSTILQLAECDTQKQMKELMLKIAGLEQEKEKLLEELAKAKSADSSQDLGTSVAVFEGKIDSATSPIKHKEKLTKSQTSLIKDGTVSIFSCKKGDIVLVLWDQKHESYIILQENYYLFFLHSDCVETMGLKCSSNEPRKLYCIAEVVDKEFCHARKAENRYKVPLGTRFYRIIVKPANLKDLTKNTQQMSQSQVSSSKMQTSQASTSLSVPTTPTKPGSVSESTVTLQDTSTSDKNLMNESAVVTEMYESSLESASSDKVDVDR